MVGLQNERVRKAEKKKWETRMNKKDRKGKKKENDGE